jgi:trehalose 6-phosphate synthase
MRPLVAGRRAHWVGRDGGSQALPDRLPGTQAQLTPVSLSRADIRFHYNGFANATIWPLFHDFVQTPEFGGEWWKGYQHASEAFSAATVAALRSLKDPVLWVHDYHFLLTPALIRASSSASIRFFLHIPWPAPEQFARLPWREELLLGLLGADVPN